MPFSIRTVVQIIKALTKHGYIEMVVKMQKKDPKAARKARPHVSDNTKVFSHRFRQ